MGWSRHWESGRHNYITNALTDSKQGVGIESGWLACTQWHTWAPMFACNNAKGVEQTWGVRWTCIHVLMHVHILIKVREHKWGDWDTNTLPYRCFQVSIKLCTGYWTDMGSQVDINSCTDACTHSNQDMCPEVGWLWQTHNATQRYLCFYQTMHRERSRHGESDGHVYMY